jgi:hypothetical protein
MITSLLIRPSSVPMRPHPSLPDYLCLGAHFGLLDGLLRTLLCGSTPAHHIFGLRPGGRRGRLPGQQAEDLGDQGGVGSAMPGVALERAGRRVQREQQQRAVGFGQVKRAFQGTPGGSGSPSASFAPTLFL